MIWSCEMLGYTKFERFSCGMLGPTRKLISAETLKVPVLINCMEDLVKNTESVMKKVLAANSADRI
jgi:hypothetical protein